MRNEFTAVFERDGDRVVAYCPEVPAANSQRRTKDEARENLAEAIPMVLEDRREDGLRSVPQQAERETITVAMRKARWFFLPAVLAAAVAFCGGNPPPGQAQFEDEEATRLSVDNQSSLDMNVYVLRSSQRIRLGTATAHLTTRFTIPSELIFGVTPLRFLADPIGSSRTPVTDEISVSPGDEVVLTIPPGSRL